MIYEPYGEMIINIFQYFAAVFLERVTVDVVKEEVKEMLEWISIVKLEAVKGLTSLKVKLLLD